MKSWWCVAILFLICGSARADLFLENARFRLTVGDDAIIKSLG